MISLTTFQTQKIYSRLAIFFLAAGILFRLFRINQNDFFLYDEGYYLHYNRLLLKFMSMHFPSTMEEWKTAILIWFRFSLATGKALWFLIADSRVFFGGMDTWYFPRIIASMAGVGTLGFLYVFAKRFFNSIPLAWLSVALLAVLPSHVFYSRLAFQEALSTFFFFSGFYFYLYPPKLNRRTFISGLLFACAYFTNYRLIIIPLILAGCEGYLSVSERKLPLFRRFIWTVVTFLAVVVLVGNLDQAQNANVTFSWMFHQGEMAQESFDWINLLSYPYYLFRLETFLFGALFFANLYWLIRRPSQKFLPFFLVCLQMLGFSFAGEKGARYICVVTPFMAIAVTQAIWEGWNLRKDPKFRTGFAALVLLTLSCMCFKSFQIATSHSDYRPAMAYILQNDPQAKVLSTQPWILKLYTDDRTIAEAPHNLRSLAVLYFRGFHYLALCPQTYISWTASQKRFDPKLEEYLGFVMTRVKPWKVFPHFNPVILERFVFEHNENLKTSIAFLDEYHKDGQIRIYRVEDVLRDLNLWMSKQPQTKL